MKYNQWVSFVDHFVFSISKAVPFTRFFAYEVTPDAQQIYAYHSRNLSEHAIEDYLQNMYEYDPVYIKNNSVHSMEMAHLLKNEIPDPYQDFLHSNKVIDNIELFFKEEQGSIRGISLIRSLDEGHFSDQEITILDSCYSLAKFQMKSVENHDEPASSQCLVNDLTNKERKVLDLVLKGKKNQDIANEMFISLATVKTHIQHIFQKTMVTNRQELILKTFC